MADLIRNTTAWHTLTRRPALLLAALTLFSAACDSCSQPATPAADLGAPTEPDMAAPEPDLGPPVDPLKEAREAAESQAQLIAVGLGDQARLVAAQIEAQAKVPDTTPTTKVRPKGNTSTEKGIIDAKDANAVFRKFDGAMKNCYERALKRSPGLEGKVQLTVIVSPAGKVSRASAKGLSLNDSTINTCMEALTPRMEFPPPKGGAARLVKNYDFKPDF